MKLRALECSEDSVLMMAILVGRVKMNRQLNLVASRAVRGAGYNMHAVERTVIEVCGVGT